MEKFSILTGKAAYIALANIDTDMIIPKQYLKTIKRSGLGEYLFAELRYDIQGKIIDSFILNQQPETKILITGENFGCGSSREHAPWALLDFGIRAIVAPSFADIFYNNCFKNGILPIKLNEKELHQIVAQEGEITIDLTLQTVTRGSLKCFFAIDAHRKEVLLEGLDDIEKVLKYQTEITSFEKEHKKRFPWLLGGCNA